MSGGDTYLFFHVLGEKGPNEIAIADKLVPIAGLASTVDVPFDVPWHHVSPA